MRPPIRVERGSGRIDRKDRRRHDDFPHASHTRHADMRRRRPASRPKAPASDRTQLIGRVSTSSSPERTARWRGRQVREAAPALAASLRVAGCSGELARRRAVQDVDELLLVDVAKRRLDLEQHDSGAAEHASAQLDQRPISGARHTMSARRQNRLYTPSTSAANSGVFENSRTPSGPTGSRGATLSRTPGRSQDPLHLRENALVQVD